MAVSLDAYATASAQNTLANGATFSFTNQTVGSGFSEALFVAVLDNSTAGTSFQVNWDTAGSNQLLTLIGSNAVTNVGNVFFYGLANATAGHKTLGVKRIAGATSSCDVFSVSLFGVDPLLTDWSANVSAGSGTSASSASLSTTTTIGSYAFSAMMDISTTPTGPTGGTVRFGNDTLNSPGAVCRGADSFSASSTVTHTYTLSPADNWVGLIVSIPFTTAVPLTLQQQTLMSM
jgi:hypothetical protein